MAGRKPHKPTDTNRQLISLHATVGTPRAIIADIIGIDEKTMRKYYREELDQATAKANATIGGALFNKAKNGDTAAQIFWMKTRARWRETNDLNLTSEDGSMSPKPALDMSKLSDEALKEIVETFGTEPDA